MEIIRDIEQVAIKEHQCNYCHARIVVGEKYRYTFISDGGYSYAWKSHLPCDALVDELEMRLDGEGVSSDDFWCYVNDRFRDICADVNSLLETPALERLRVVKIKHGIL